MQELRTSNGRPVTTRPARVRGESAPGIQEGRVGGESTWMSVVLNEPSLGNSLVGRELGQ